MDDERRDIAVTLLAWYRDMGVDAVLADEPVDWIEHGGRAPGESIRAMLQSGVANSPTAAPSSRPAAPPQQSPSSARPMPAATAPPRAFASKPPDAAETAARVAARSAASIGALATAIDAFDGCGLKATASRSCVYRGAETARLMIIGEAPGRDEDLEGKPFVGRAGQLLDKMLSAIGLTEADVHITNVVYWRPPGNRTPTPQEAQVCRPFLERQVELVKPDVVLLLGGAAAKHVLDVSDGIMRLRGTWKDLTMGQHRARALPSLHPAYLLRTPAYKRQAWLDLLAVKAALARS
ncbi:MAG: uracil-DNA glycosylase [Hyphomicrobium sp.]